MIRMVERRHHLPLGPELLRRMTMRQQLTLITMRGNVAWIHSCTRLGETHQGMQHGVLVPHPHEGVREGNTRRRQLAGLTNIRSMKRKKGMLLGANMTIDHRSDTRSE